MSENLLAEAEFWMDLSGFVDMPAPWVGSMERAGLMNQWGIFDTASVAGDFETRANFCLLIREALK